MTDFRPWPMEAVTGTWVESVHYHTEIPSTNTHALHLALEGAPEGTLVLADSQSAGRGRLGRAWWDEPGTHLLLSFILRPGGDMERWPRVGLAAALALAQVIAPKTAHTVHIKWPNDVLVGEKKVAGILLETALQAHPPALVLGMGINLTAERLPDELQHRAAALSAFTFHRPDRAVFLRDLVLALGQTLPLIHRPSRLNALCTPLLYGLGHPITLHTSGGMVHGRFEGLAEDGRLILASPNGLQSYYAGDVSLSPL